MVEKRRRRWVLPVVLLAGAGAVVVSRSRRRVEVDDEWITVPPAAVPAARTVTPAEPADVAPEPAEVAPEPAEPGAPPVPAAATPAALASADRGVTAVAPVPGSAERFGPGSAAARPDGSPPGPEYPIKGSVRSKVFHPPASPYYGRVRAEVWFRSAADAEAAGFRAYRSRSRG